MAPGHHKNEPQKSDKSFYQKALDLQALQEERKHLETLFADRINFYLVFAAGVLAFLFAGQPPQRLVRLALLTVTIMSGVMVFALFRTLLLVMRVLTRLIKDYPEEPYPRFQTDMPWYLPNANYFLIALPIALTVFFACALWMSYHPGCALPHWL